ncbi:MAG: hypothetical protein EOP09_00455, partial [Proteobacteria bacterium]
LAQVLGPGPFGLIAMTALLSSLSSLVVDSGMSAGLIQSKILKDEDVVFVFTLQIIVGLALAVVLLLAAPPLSRYFHQPQLTSLIPFVSLTVLIQSASQVPIALLKRKFDHKSVQLAQVGSYFAGYALVGIPLALLDAGVWSLIAAQVVQSALNLTMVLRGAKHSLKFSLRGDWHLVRFGSNILGANILNWAFSSVDATVLGRLYGSTTLGIYNRINFLASTPIGIPLGAAQNILLSGSAHLQSDRERLKRSFLGVWQVVSILTWPLLLSMAAVSRTVVEGLYGSKWEVGIPLVAPLAIAVGVNAHLALMGPVLTGIGKAREEFRQVAWTFVLASPVILLGGYHSVHALAWAVVIARVIFLMLMAVPVFTELGLAPSALVRSTAQAIFLGGLIAATVYAADCVLIDRPSTLRLFILLGLGAVLYGVVFLAFSRRTLPFEARDMVKGYGPFRKLIGSNT